MLDLRDLYQEVIIDHNRNPRNCRAMDDATSHAEGFNPLCGDRLTLYLKIQNDIVKDASFKGNGCAISTASASLMTESVIGKTLAEAKLLFQNFHDMLLKDDKTAEQKLGKLSVLAGVKAYPARVKCATLAWHTLNAAIEKKHETVSTE
ncbi:MAG: SUF system NifU family Fe-S cluster assembly protein [Proteobacteria bacterium]|nr:SUF system NifU family Fe-S cluster assembly protein [Pseudomonadota bacterium]